MITHGIEVIEGATQKPETTQSARAIVVLGVLPVNMADDPASTVNTPILAHSPQEAMRLLGFSNDFKHYGACEMMLMDIAPVVYLNVLDPVRHRKALPETTVSVRNYRAQVSQDGILKAGLTVKAGDTELAEGTDYITDFTSEGWLSIDVFADGAAAEAEEITVSGWMLDPDAVTKDDIIGAYNPRTGTETGAEAIRQVYPKTGYVPGEIIAPGWSHVPEVGIALTSAAERVNGVFRAMAILDLDTELARDLEAAKTQRLNAGYTSPFGYAYWPKARRGSQQLHMSTVMAAQAAALDAANDNVPVQSPSNRIMGITGLCLEDGTDVYLDQDQASELNEAGICTAINLNGWRSWGNYTCAYTSTDDPEADPKNYFICMRRMMNWLDNEFILRWFSRVDEPLRPVLIQTIIDSWNQYLIALAAEQRIAGGEMTWIRTQDAAIDAVLKGKLQFAQRVGLYGPMQLAQLESVLDLDITVDALMGGVA